MSKQSDNPNQRICEVADRFVDGLTGLALGLPTAVGTLVSFLIVLRTISGSMNLVLWGMSFTIPG